MPCSPFITEHYLALKCNQEAGYPAFSPGLGGISGTDRGPGREASSSPCPVPLRLWRMEAYRVF